MRSRGFGIAETLIASTIIATLVLAFMGITTVINRSAVLANQQAVAADLAQHRIEVLRWFVETNWNNSRLQTTQVVATNEWAQNVQSDLSPLTLTVGGITYSAKVTVEPVLDGESISARLPIYARNAAGNLVQAQAHETDPLYRRVHVDVTWSDGGSPRSYSLETVFTNWREGIL